MKKSEFEAYLKEQIISELSNTTPEDIENQKEYNKELETTKQLAKDLDLVESTNMLNDEYYDRIDDVVEDSEWMYVSQYVSQILSYAQEDGFARGDVLAYITDRLHKEF